MARGFVELDRSEQFALLLGGIALVAAAFAPGLVGAVPVLPLIVSLAMVGGVVALLRWSDPRGHGDRAHGVLLALAPFLAAGILVRLLAGDPGSSMQVALRETALPEMLGLLAGLATYVVADRVVDRARPALHAGAAGLVLAVALFVWHVVQARPITVGERNTLLVTAVIVGCALVVQVLVGRHWPRLGWMARAGALVVAFAQLLDGVVSTLAVRDPFGWLGGRHEESVALSAFLIDLAGPAFPLVKWAIALVVVGVLEREAGDGHWTNRFLVLLVATFLGLGPGLFSTLRVFS